jgi:1-acyl-sn-glycerol-3-phosphate acyltransferase
VGAIPALGPRVPRRDSAFLRCLGRAGLRALGWRIEGALPDLPRFVIAVAPHTSNWDFVVGAATMFALDIRLAFLGKHTLFRGPLGVLMRAMGGIPVDRRRAHGVVDDAIAALRAADQSVLAVAPEGTRSPVARLKSGFVHIARGAGVPIMLATLDGEHRCVRLGPVIEPGDDVDAELARIESHYRGVRGWRAKPFPATAGKKAPPG